MRQHLIQHLLHPARHGGTRRSRLRSHGAACAAGLAVMLGGVYIAHLAHHVEPFAAQLLVDALGYSLHGIGLMPFVTNAEPLWAALFPAVVE